MRDRSMGLLLLAGVVAGTAAIRPAVPRGGGTPAPELTNTSWLNSDHPLRLAELRGRVVLLNFWVFTCGNCTRTVPSLVAYDRTYRDSGLTIIGIHTPEFPPYAGEHDKGNLARALARQGITYPNAQDNDRHVWDAYGIQYWPSFVLIDKRGIIRYTGYGEFHVDDGDYREWDRRIRQLLAERVPLIALEAGPAPSLRLVAAPGVRINARLKPALELDDGTVLRFDSPYLTPDSAYFAAPPTAAPVPPGGPHRGTLRASVCPSQEKFCRSVELAVTW
jgi:thiol-disulfide isomerase/thioredoxin